MLRISNVISAISRPRLAGLASALSVTYVNVEFEFEHVVAG
jgi:hypothetical protein